MGTSKQSRKQQGRLAKGAALALGIVLSIAAFNGYRQHMAHREAETVRQLRASVQESRRDLLVLVPASLELNYHAQVVWTYCLLPGRPELDRVRRRANAAILRTLQRETRSTRNVLERAGALDGIRQTWKNPDLRREYIQLAALLKYQEENARSVIESAIQTGNMLAKL